MDHQGFNLYNKDIYTYICRQENDKLQKPYKDNPGSDPSLNNPNTDNPYTDDPDVDNPIRLNWVRMRVRIIMALFKSL